MTQTSDGPAETYRRRIAELSERERALGRRADRLSHARLGAFFLLVGFGLWLERRPGTLPLVLMLLTLGVFAGLIVVHARIRRRERWFRELRGVNEEGTSRLGRAWDDLPPRRPPAALQNHAYAADMDLYGRASVAQLLGPVGSAMGRNTLDGWLLSPTDPGAVRARQEAVRELAGRNGLRDRLAVLGRRTSEVRSEDLEGFLRWAEGDPWLLSRPALTWTAWLLPAATWALMVFDYLGIIGPPLWLITLVVTLVVSLWPGRHCRAIFEAAFSREGLFEHFPELFDELSSASFGAPLLKELRAELFEGDMSADRQLDRVKGLMHLADLRYSGMLYLPVQLLSLLDFHVLRRLEHWQLEAGDRVRRWLAVLGELEALASLATLAHDHPDWAFPELVEEGPARIEATGIGHPLLAPEERVHNDVEVGPPGTFLLVTGSNMSGKSTLLRSIGTNVILAQTGGPVCAEAMRLPPTELFTSIRVQDSLARGVSFFMAELERLKRVVDAADRRAREGGAAFLYLLDEMLQGTNTAERRIAARRILGHLVETGAIGAVTTHDLTLATGAEIEEAAVPVHFTETVRSTDEGPAMSFDYRLRPGIATSTNALKLMEIVGLGLES